MKEDKWCCYLISSRSHPTSTYIGSTNNIARRLDQHNSILIGGAKATRKHNDWELIKLVEQPDRSAAIRFEYYWKHYKTKSGTWRNTRSGIDNKLKRLLEIT